MVLGCLGGLQMLSHVSSQEEIVQTGEGEALTRKADQREVATIQRPPEATKSWKRQEGPSPEPPQGVQPWDSRQRQLMMDCGPPELRG